MAVTRPVIFTEVTETETEFTRPVSEETVRKLAQNINMLRALCPYAEVRGIHTNLGGYPGVSSSWQFCDGAEITHPSSPLNTGGVQNVPSMGNRFIMGAPDPVGTEDGGNGTANFSHAHTTGNTPTDGNDCDAGTDHNSALTLHNHTISTQSLTVDLDPSHMKIAYYMRVYR